MDVQVIAHCLSKTGFFFFQDLLLQVGTFVSGFNRLE